MAKDSECSPEHPATRYGLAAVLICVALATMLAPLSHWQREPMSLQDRRFTTYSSIIAATTPSELPQLPSGSNWISVTGLNVRTLDATKNGQVALRLTAIPELAAHGLSVRIDHLKSGTNYRTKVWTKDPIAANLLLEIRGSDLSDERMVVFDLKDKAIVRWSGRILDSGSDTDSNDWEGHWVDIKSRDESLYTSVFLLLAESNTERFRGSGQQLTLGGIKVKEHNRP